MLVRRRDDMSRRKGFTREQRRRYDSLKRLGLTDKEVASSFGISPSTLSRTKNKKTRLSQRSIDKLDAPKPTVRDINTGTLISSDPTKITYEELQFLADVGRSPRTRKLAEDAIDDIDSQGFTIGELQELTFDRPVFYRTYKGKRIKLLLGRSKGDLMQNAVRKQLRKEGIDFGDADYIDFGGYGGVRV